MFFRIVTLIFLALVLAACSGAETEADGTDGPSADGPTTPGDGDSVEGSVTGGNGGGDGGGDGDTVLPPVGDSPVVINEVTSAGADFIEFYNRSDEPVNLTGWWYIDDNPSNETYFFSDELFIQPGEFLVKEKDVHHQFGLGGSDEVNLYRADGTLMDATAWDSGEAVISWCRIPDGTGAFRSCLEQTFGESNGDELVEPVCGNDEAEPTEECDGTDLRDETCESLGFDGGTLACESDCSAFDVSGCDEPSEIECEGNRCVVINEVTSQDDDDVELLNIGEVAINISGWTLIDQPEDDNTPWPIPAGTMIEPGEYLIFDRNDYGFGLGNDDAIYLYNGDELVDFTDWPDRAARGSWCRIPDGVGDFRTCSERTFGEPNLP